MAIIQKGIRLVGKDYYKTHLRIINEFIPIRLTEIEMEVLSAFMSLDEAITISDMFNPLARKKVKEMLNMSASSLSNHLKTLKNKKYISEKEGTLIITEGLFPSDFMQGYQLKIIKE